MKILYNVDYVIPLLKVFKNLPNGNNNFKTYISLENQEEEQTSVEFLNLSVQKLKNILRILNSKHIPAQNKKRLFFKEL